jgi:hypothetical protein
MGLFFCHYLMATVATTGSAQLALAAILLALSHSPPLDWFRAIGTAPLAPNVVTCTDEIAAACSDRAIPPPLESA